MRHLEAIVDGTDTGAKLSPLAGIPRALRFIDSLDKVTVQDFMRDSIGPSDGPCHVRETTMGDILDSALRRYAGK